jgi:hypothetical protein
MGIYMYVSNEDRITKRKVTDAVVNEEFQEALKYDPSLMIEEYTFTKKRKFFSSWFSENVPQTRYSVYHETPAHDGSAYQARLQGSASGDKNIVIAYLHGIINGCVHTLTPQR